LFNAFTLFGKKKKKKKKKKEEEEGFRNPKTWILATHLMLQTLLFTGPVVLHLIMAQQPFRPNSASFSFVQLWVYISSPINDCSSSSPPLFTSVLQFVLSEKEESYKSFL
jgi:hypothetical protein